MYSNLVNRLRRSFSFRLNLWYASIFTLSACSLFFFLYLLLSVAIGRIRTRRSSRPSLRNTPRRI